MIKIGITGSLASGKTTASKIISAGRGPLFNADIVVKKLYKKNNFRTLIAKKLGFKLNINFKKNLTKKILEEKQSLKKLEKVIHPLVKKEMIIFSRKNKSKKYLFFEIPLLVESKLTSYFDAVIFIKSKVNLRLKRYKFKGGSIKLFAILDNHQLKDTIKMKRCSHIVVNNKSLTTLKENLFNIIKLYE